MTQITIPLPESLVLAIGVLLAFGLASALVVFAMMPAKAKPKEAIASFQSQMGLDRLPTAVFFLMVTSWGAIFLVLLVGILITIFHTIWWEAPRMLPDDSAADRVAIWDWRFSIAKLTALTAVLGAVVALPFTVIRLKLSREQTETAKSALVNDKMNAAVADLYAQRQITKWNSDTNCHEDIWEDDITRRNGAIDRLRGLTKEQPELLERVDRLLTVYLQELTREYPPESPPIGATEEQLIDWANNLKPARVDMQNAVIALAALERPPHSEGQPKLPDLSGINMQGFKLWDIKLNYANLNRARLEGADLRRAHLNGADLRGGQFIAANFSSAQLRYADLSPAEI
ncbi:pentapeptide repeat-containing protein [Sulfitobacter mediterraneus]|uniref:pentapeptide repeat-containing protein n=1 Tax=Sulfitobacter mediterraneus TaxID=83219 RepID=UPI00193949C7|nr:pentapeptide repeat-containing protein [Sulfitobacter mediterraneus]MBM1558331.1 pentapeptide repeat-containing protein [Sulfitobacter mediterraneus]MBM1568569.1 pentapeptide repeat-containing protein [Sulfitobacter mediterraneus]MBM1573537.1 pentapeptide repeat-containing protein [Sulfitobacter mediterraneus]MBM1576430.1 pentapeptide repeat-containing protein [Sulfitobacter mediterraneus]MBM1581320.1 pentapeptide repeat-containing protein [Sulfitobacter mediterraneus]